MTTRLLRCSGLGIAVELLLCHPIVAEPAAIHLAEVAENRNHLELVFRRYVAIREVAPRCRVELEAKKYATSPERFWWSLDLRVTDPLEESRSTESHAITGSDGLLFNCLDRFLEDVPDANVWSVSIDMRADHRIWERVQASLRPIIDRTDGIEDAKSRELRQAFNAALKESPEARDLAQRIALKLDGKLVVWHLNADGLVSSSEYRDKPWQDRRKDPYLGLDMRWIPMGISLKPNRGPSE